MVVGKARAKPQDAEKFFLFDTLRGPGFHQIQISVVRLLSSLIYARGRSERGAATTPIAFFITGSTLTPSSNPILLYLFFCNSVSEWDVFVWSDHKSAFLSVMFKPQNDVSLLPLGLLISACVYVCVALIIPPFFFLLAMGADTFFCPFSPDTVLVWCGR